MQIANSPGLRRRIIWSIAALIVLVVFGFGVFNAVALPGCRSCHGGEGFRVATAAAPHAKVDCRSCHVPTGLAGRLTYSLGEPLHMFPSRGNGAERDAASVPDTRCLRCHEDVLKTVVASNGLRIVHSSCAADASCTDCHSTTAHGAATSWVRLYDMDTCLACHVGNGQTECNLCHEGRRPASRIESGTFAVTHGAHWRTTHGMGNAATCTVCHQPADCVECHGAGVPHESGFVETHAEYAARSDQRCASCHESSFCDSCHGTPMPHSALFTREHAKTAEAQPEVCRRCHVDSDCTNCHETHVHPGGATASSPATEGGG